MPVLEVTELRLKGVAPTDPSLLKNLSTVRGILQTQSHFYSCIENSTLVFILGLWPSLQAHEEFLASSRAGEILSPQEGMLEFRWTVHLELDAMASLPLDAPVMALARRVVKQDDVDAYDKAAAKEKQSILESSNHKVACGWRLDAAPGLHESLLFTGWDSTQAHAAFSARQKGLTTSMLYEVLETHHAWNLERTPT